jgi:hypothetical protein
VVRKDVKQQIQLPEMSLPRRNRSSEVNRLFTKTYIFENRGYYTVKNDVVEEERSLESLS